MNTCIRCENEVKSNNSGAAASDLGYETRDGTWIHNGCSMLIEGGRPMPKGSLAELIAARQRDRQ